MTTTSARPLIRRRVLTGLLATAALAAAGAGAAADRAAAATAQVQGATLVVNGNRASDRIALRLEAGVPANLQVDFGDDGTADATFDRATFDHIAVNAGRGDDTVRIDDANAPFTDTELTTVSGGRGDDTLLGGRGNEVLLGGSGDDVIDGNQGSDIAFMGDDDDTFIWDPGDGSDVIEGQGGYDTMDFRGSGGNERFDMSANGSRLRFFRDLGNITMDTDDVERVALEALGGTDTTTVNDLRSTDVRQVAIDLAPALGAAGGDGAADSVIVNGTPGDDDVTMRPQGGKVAVQGLAARVTIANPEAANDSLTLNALGGDDTIQLGKGLSGLIHATVNA